MNIDSIRRLLCSENEEDNLLALNIIRGNHLGNWGGFLTELESVCHGYFYYTPPRRGEYRPYSTGAVEIQRHLWDKYFTSVGYNDIKPHWYHQID